MKHYELPAGTDREQRQQRGVFYTPDSIVDFMVANALHGKQFPLKICDYSCGGGAFLAGVLRYFKKHFPEKASEAARHLYGIDIDPAALQLAKKMSRISRKVIFCVPTPCIFPFRKQKNSTLS